MTGINIVDPLDHIRKNPSMYLGVPEPTGEILASRMVEDLICMRAMPAQIDHQDGWWIIHSAKDWLSEIDLSSDTDNPFSGIVPMPEAGDNSYHAEILLVAFADAVATLDGDGLKWIKGSPQFFSLPGSLSVPLSLEGRIIAFRLGRALV